MVSSLVRLLLVAHFTLAAGRRQSSKRSAGAHAVPTTSRGSGPPSRSAHSRTTFSASRTTTYHSPYTSSPYASPRTTLPASRIRHRALRTHAHSGARRTTSTVYYLPKARYVGQTKRKLSARLAEHSQAGKDTRGAVVLARSRTGRAVNRLESMYIARYDTFMHGGNQNRGPDPVSYRRVARPSPLLTLLRRQLRSKRNLWH